MQHSRQLFKMGCRNSLIRVLLGLLVIAVAGFLAFNWFWNRSDLTTNFEAKAAERAAIVAKIKAGEYSLQDARTMGEAEDRVILSQAQLPETDNRVSRNDRVLVAQKAETWEIAFQIRTWQFGDGQLFFVYRSDEHLAGKHTLTASDFLLFTGANFFEATPLGPHWYQVVEVW